MKQHITIKQYHELSDEAKIKLVEWIGGWTKDTDKMTLPHQDMTVGRMIEFLFERGKWRKFTWDLDEQGVETELVDALWEEVREALNEESRN